MCIRDSPNLLRQCVRLVATRYRIPEDAIKMQLEPCEIRGERIDLVMIFRNLIDNAVKYAGQPLSVKVNLNVDNNFAVVQICDNGPGIPTDLRSNVFSRFVRVGDELQREKPGTGLGLHIVKTLLKRARGKIKVMENSGEDSGSIFEVKLPGAYRPANRNQNPKPVTVNF